MSAVNVGTARTRTFSWADPLASAGRAAEMDGLTAMRAILSGDLPPAPIGSLLGMELVEAEPGRVVFRLEPAEWMYNPIGSVHGGIAATLLDSCMGCAVHTTLPAGVGYTTTDLQVRYLGAMSHETGPVLAEGTVVHSGGRVATAEGRLVSADGGRVLAHGTTGCLILRPR
jgi:uncharacterized protein (TIGR00369 family)